MAPEIATPARRGAQGRHIPRNARLRNEILGAAVLLTAVFVVGALLAHAPPGRACWANVGSFGPVGTCTRATLLAIVGPFSAPIIAILLALYSFRLLSWLQAEQERRWRLFGFGLVALVAIADALVRRAIPGTGGPHPTPDAIGGVGAYVVVKAFGVAGCWVVLALGFCVLIMTTFARNPIRLIVTLGRRLPSRSPSSASETSEDSRISVTGEATFTDPHVDEFALPDEFTRANPVQQSQHASSAAVRRRSSTTQRAMTQTAPSPTVARQAESERTASELPPIELLSTNPGLGAAVIAQQSAELEVIGYRLAGALRTLKFDGQLVGRVTGASVTRYDIEPAPGVRLADFGNLTNDLATALRIQAIRIVAPNAGRATLGVEIPNPSPDVVSIRELLQSHDYESASRALPIAIGRGVAGQAVFADLARTPNLLIVGDAGSGKSVCISAITTSLVYSHGPGTLRMVMVDDNSASLASYDALPHTLFRIDPRNGDVARGLAWLVTEMDRRCEVFARSGARNIQDFNQKLHGGASSVPYLVVIIAELAELSTCGDNDASGPLGVLVQNARAVGMHFVVATRQPNVAGLAALVRANCPSRVALRVQSQRDSRGVIDSVEAESLAGNGDMLFFAPGKTESVRVQGALVSGEDTSRVIAWYAGRGHDTDRTDANVPAIEEQLAPFDELVYLTSDSSGRTSRPAVSKQPNSPGQGQQRQSC
jgi:S-DNA-T family DNA segregation ATPase FtsK/SpoIIIE